MAEQLETKRKEVVLAKSSYIREITTQEMIEELKKDKNQYQLLQVIRQFLSDDKKKI